MDNGMIRYWAHMLDEAMGDGTTDHGYDLDPDNTTSDFESARNEMRHQLQDTTLDENGIQKLYKLLYPRCADWRFVELMLKDGYRLSSLHGTPSSIAAQVEKKLAEKGLEPKAFREFKADREAREAKYKREEAEWKAAGGINSEKAMQNLENAFNQIFNWEGADTTEIGGLPEPEPMFVSELVADIKKMASVGKQAHGMFVNTERQFGTVLSDGFDFDDGNNASVVGVAVRTENGKRTVHLLANQPSREIDNEIDKVGDYEDVLRKLRPLPGNTPVKIDLEGESRLISRAALTRSDLYGDEWIVLHLIV